MSTFCSSGPFSWTLKLLKNPSEEGNNFFLWLLMWFLTWNLTFSTQRYHKGSINIYWCVWWRFDYLLLAICCLCCISVSIYCKTKKTLYLYYHTTMWKKYNNFELVLIITGCLAVTSVVRRLWRGWALLKTTLWFLICRNGRHRPSVTRLL